jgi:hypothetical protein
MTTSELLSISPAILVIILFLIIGLSAFPAIYRELIFYNQNHWNMKADSGSKIFAQDDYQRRLFFLPLGIIKLLYHASRIVMMLSMAPLAAAIIRHFR